MSQVKCDSRTDNHPASGYLATAAVVAEEAHKKSEKAWSDLFLCPEGYRCSVVNYQEMAEAIVQEGLCDGKAGSGPIAPNEPSWLRQQNHL